MREVGCADEIARRRRAAGIAGLWREPVAVAGKTFPIGRAADQVDAVVLFEVFHIGEERIEVRLKEA